MYAFKVPPGNFLKYPISQWLHHILYEEVYISDYFIIHARSYPHMIKCKKYNAAIKQHLVSVALISNLAISFYWINILFATLIF